MDIFDISGSKKVNCEVRVIDSVVRGGFIGALWGLSFYRALETPGISRIRYVLNNLCFSFISFIGLQGIVLWYLLAF